MRGGTAVTAGPIPIAPAMPYWRAVLAFGLGALFFCFAFVQRVAPSVMVEDLMRDFALGAALVGNLTAFYFYAYAGMQVPIGILMDRIGPRRMLTAFALLCMAGNLLFAVADSVTVAYAGRLLIGLGAAAGWVGTLTLATQWLPPRRFQLLGGIGQVFGMSGAVFGQAPLGLAVESYGWRTPLYGMAAFGLLLALAVWIVARDKPRTADGAGGARVIAGLRVVVANPQTWLNALIGLALTGPMLAFAGLWAVPYFGSVHGYDRPAAAGLASLMFIGWAAAAPLIGWIADSLGRRQPILVAGAAVLTAALLALFYLPGLPQWSIAALIVASGVAGSTMILTFALVRDANPPETSGAAYGFVNTAVTGSGALLQPLIGFLLDLNWDGAMAAGARIYGAEAYGTALLVLPACSALGLVAALGLRDRRPSP